MVTIMTTKPAHTEEWYQACHYINLIFLHLNVPQQLIAEVKWPSHFIFSYSGTSLIWTSIIRVYTNFTMRAPLLIYIDVLYHNWFHR